MFFPLSLLTPVQAQSYVSATTFHPTASAFWARSFNSESRAVFGQLRLEVLHDRHEIVADMRPGGARLLRREQHIDNTYARSVRRG